MSGLPYSRTQAIVYLGVLAGAICGAAVGLYFLAKWLLF